MGIYWMSVRVNLRVVPEQSPGIAHYLTWAFQQSAFTCLLSQAGHVFEVYCAALSPCHFAVLLATFPTSRSCLTTVQKTSFAHPLYQSANILTRSRCTTIMASNTTSDSTKRRLGADLVAAQEKYEAPYLRDMAD